MYFVYDADIIHSYTQTKYITPPMEIKRVVKILNYVRCKHNN